MGGAELHPSTEVFVGLSSTEQTSREDPRHSDRPAHSLHEEWSDLELIAAVVARSDRAFAELFRRHYHSVVWSSRMILINGPQCEDIGAEVLFEFWLEPEKFDPSRGTLLSFLRVKAKGRSIDFIRSESSRSRRERHDADRSETIEVGVDVQILSRESLTRLREALAQLPPDEREPIELAFFGGLSYVAVAQHLGLPEGTVKARIRCGLGRLRLACLTQDIARGQRVETVTSANPPLAHNERDHEDAR
jgi:RNA polymerase sigma-70 factor (ECF subfamily)